MIDPLRFSARSIALVYIAMSLLVLLLFATPIYYGWHAIVEERSTARLREDTQRLSSVLKRHGAGELREVINALVEAQPAGDEKFILLTDETFHRVAGNLKSWPLDIPQNPGTYARSLQYEGQAIEAIFVRATLADGSNLIVGRNISKFKVVEDLFWAGLIGSAATVMLFGVCGGFLIRKALLAEVYAISQTAAAIVSGDLSRRLPARNVENELGQLTRTINRMLDQIEQLIQATRNVSNSIAHELRTPLTELRSRLEVLTLTRPAPNETYLEIDHSIADVDRVITIFNALLRLAEIDNGARRSGFQNVDLVNVVNDAVEFYQPLAELKGVALRCSFSPQLTIFCDALLVAQAIGNLIDNALKYAIREVCIGIRFAQRAENVIEIDVIDDGPGIPDAEKSKVVERFYRVDRSRASPGVGLGLALVSAVAKLHGGDLILADANPGLRATLKMTRSVGRLPRFRLGGALRRESLTEVSKIEIDR